MTAKRYIGLTYLQRAEFVSSFIKIALVSERLVCVSTDGRTDGHGYFDLSIDGDQKYMH